MYIENDHRSGSVELITVFKKVATMNIVFVVDYMIKEIQSDIIVSYSVSKLIMLCH